MKFRLLESTLLHWGDLDFGRKADRRQIMAGRGTGHFGTGFYFVNKDNYVDDNGNLKYDYNKDRPIYELDSMSYNLFTPKDNNQAFKFHDALSDINNYYKPELDEFLVKGHNTMDSDGLEEELDRIEDSLYDMYYNSDVWDDDVGDFIPTFSEEEADENFDEDCKNAFIKFVLDNGLEPYIPYSDVESRINGESISRAKDDIKRAIDKKSSVIDRLISSVSMLKDIFGVSYNELLERVSEAYSDEDYKDFSLDQISDSISTRLIKSFGYDGVDVSHLKDTGNYPRGLDNFEYGTVIYDLKPGTFRKVSDPSNEKRVGKKI